MPKECVFTSRVNTCQSQNKYDNLDHRQVRRMLKHDWLLAGVLRISHRSLDLNTV